jgi:hypothetical protein
MPDTARASFPIIGLPQPTMLVWALSFQVLLGVVAVTEHVFKAPLGGAGLGGLEPDASVRDQADPGEDLIRLDEDVVAAVDPLDPRRPVAERRIDGSATDRAVRTRESRTREMNLPELWQSQQRRSEPPSIARHMHAPEPLCLCETVVSAVAAERSNYSARPQQLDSPVDTHLAEALS